MATDADRFEAVDWTTTSAGRGLSARTVAFGLSVVAVAAAFAYDYAVLPAGERLAFGWSPHGVDWLYAVSLSAFFLYVLVPLARNRRRTAHLWRRLRSNRLAVASLAWVTAFFLTGLFAPLVVGAPETHPNALHNPPVGFAVNDLLAGGCAGAVADGMCHGSWRYPLGTTGGGRDVAAYTAVGAGVALKVGLITVTILVPIAVVVGTVAAQLGGRVDAALMRYVDLQGAIPPFFVYIVVQFLYYPTLALMVVVFGLLNWGGVARLVRAEALRKRQEGYVLAARASGNRPLRIVRKHVVPNVSATILTAVTLQVPTLVIIEATLSYLGLGDPRVYSWGQLIGVGMKEFPAYWWVPTVPVVVLALTVIALNVLGDALRDVLDPTSQP